jgi:hypothetical protein
MSGFVERVGLQVKNAGDGQEAYQQSFLVVQIVEAGAGAGLDEGGDLRGGHLVERFPHFAAGLVDVGEQSLDFAVHGSPDLSGFAIG